MRSRVLVDVDLAACFLPKSFNRLALESDDGACLRLMNQHSHVNVGISLRSISLNHVISKQTSNFFDERGHIAILANESQYSFWTLGIGDIQLASEV